MEDRPLITVSVDGEPKAIIATPTKCATTTMEAVARRHMRRAEQIEGVDSGWLRLMDWDSPRRQHRMALPPNRGAENWAEADRWLLVRNPYKRYMSVYEYLRSPQNYSQWGARWVQGREWPGLADGPWRKLKPMTFKVFLGWLADQRENGPERPDWTEGGAYRSPWVWTDSLDDSKWFLQHAHGGKRRAKVHRLRNERLFPELSALLKDYGVPVTADRHGLGVFLGEVHSNRTTHPFLGSAQEEWGRVGCEDSLVSGLGGDLCGDCAACQIGVADEAWRVGYVGPLGMGGD